MAIESAISWTDATFNPWIGCTEVSVGALGACVNCYARNDNTRRKWVEGWGPGAPRRRTAPSNWKQPLKWDRQHADFFASTGRHRRVFSASLADIFDNEVDDSWRADFWELVRATPNLRWLILTKRIGNAPKMLPADWPYPNAGLGASIVSQAEWDRDFWKLMSVPAAFRFVSDEPTVAPIDIRGGYVDGGPKVDWIITGGESGANRRALEFDHARSMRDQCAAAGIAYHHKQNGGLRGKDTGCLLDGEEHKYFPAALAAA